MLTQILLLIGAVLLAMVVVEPAVRRLPMSSALVYLLVGWVAALAGTPLSRVDPAGNATLMQVLSEWAVLISLFAIGLRLRQVATRGTWRLALLLASNAMVITIALAAACAVWLLDLPWPAALLLAAIIAPTDPVLAADVRIRDADDRDAVRFSLSAEGALNDASAFPIVMLALGLMGLHGVPEFGPGYWLWHDLIWPIGGGAGIGWLLGRGVGLALRSRLRAHHPVTYDDLLYLGLIALSYGIASALHLSAFLAVFMTATALFDSRRAAGIQAEASDVERRLLAFGERCERLVEVSMVMFIGAAMIWVEWRWQVVAFAAAVLLIARPISVWAVIRQRAMPAAQRRMVAWFGIRGVGSLFYLMYALRFPLEESLLRDLMSACLAAVAMSIVLHGISATPLMAWYQQRRMPAPPQA